MQLRGRMFFQLILLLSSGEFWIKNRDIKIFLRVMLFVVTIAGIFGVFG